jgi:hypothetical protein
VLLFTSIVFVGGIWVMTFVGILVTVNSFFVRGGGVDVWIEFPSSLENPQLVVKTRNNTEIIFLIIILQLTVITSP